MRAPPVPEARDIAGTIYLDFNATTPVDPEVLEAMLPFLRGAFGNPSSDSPLGRAARAAIERARAEVAELIGARPDEILFTGGATEASNLAIRGAVVGERTSVVTTAIEHPATEACCAVLEARGRGVHRVMPGPGGVVEAQAMIAALGPATGLVTMIHAQNEIGTLQPVAEVAAAARAAGARVHADAAQSLGKVPVDVDALGVDLLSIAGHKLYAPKGVGALFVRRGVEVRPVLVGAGQERGLRPGTENVAYIAGLGTPCRLACARLDETGPQLRALTELLLALLRARVPGLLLVGAGAERLPNTLNLLFPGIAGRELLQDCTRVIASTGSACHAGSEEPSAILAALGIERRPALGAVRLSLGRATTRAEVEAAADDLAAAWRRLSATDPAAPSRSIPA